MSFDPYSIEAHYSLDRACQIIYSASPRSVRICTRNADIAVAVVRRLSSLHDGLSVETPEIAAVVRERLGRQVAIPDTYPTTDAAVVPFATREYASPPDASLIVAVAENRMSYKSLLRSRRISGTSVDLHRWLGQTHEITQSIGMFTPTFVTLWALSLAAGTRWPSAHFRLGQYAMDRIYSTSPLRWTGFVNIVAGIRR